MGASSWRTILLFNNSSVWETPGPFCYSTTAVCGSCLRWLAGYMWRLEWVCWGPEFKYGHAILCGEAQGLEGQLQGVT